MAGQTKKQIVRVYAGKLQENPLYGAMLFPVLYALTRKNIKQCLLAITEDGVSIWEPGTKARSLFLFSLSRGVMNGASDICDDTIIYPTAFLLTPKTIPLLSFSPRRLTLRAGAAQAGGVRRDQLVRAEEGQHRHHLRLPRGPRHRQLPDGRGLRDR